LIRFGFSLKEFTWHFRVNEKEAKNTRKAKKRNEKYLLLVFILFSFYFQFTQEYFPTTTTQHWFFNFIAEREDINLRINSTFVSF